MKPYIWWTGDPWSAILSLAALIIVVSLVGIAVIFFTYSQYKKSIISERAYTDVIEDQHYCPSSNVSREYETQSLDIYVPADDSLVDLHELKKAYRLTLSQQTSSSHQHDPKLTTVF